MGFEGGFVFKGFLLMCGSFLGPIFGDVFGTQFLKTGTGYSTYFEVPKVAPGQSKYCL